MTNRLNWFVEGESPAVVTGALTDRGGALPACALRRAVSTANGASGGFDFGFSFRAQWELRRKPQLGLQTWSLDVERCELRERTSSVRALDTGVVSPNSDPVSSIIRLSVFASAATSSL